MQQGEEIATYLKGLPYPVAKGEIKHGAKKHGAPKDVVKMLDKLPFRTFKSASEIMNALGFAGYETVGYETADEALKGQAHNVA